MGWAGRVDQRLWIEFAAIALAHGLAVASPGPDFTLILRQSLRSGRATALRSAGGIGCGILVHVCYSVMGLGLVLKNSATAYAALTWLGAAYLGWLGWQSMRSAGTIQPEAGLTSGDVAERGAWCRGFLTNVLNPKAALFFIALYTVVVDPHTPKWVQAAYGGWMALATMAWFSVVAVVFTRESWRRSYLRMGAWIDRLLGIVFWGFALNILLSMT